MRNRFLIAVVFVFGVLMLGPCLTVSLPGGAGSFLSSLAFAVDYYVNDASTANGVYCTAVGNSTNDGLSPSTPKDDINDAIGLSGSGDVVFVDTGTYNLSAAVSIVSDQPGVTVLGSTYNNNRGTILDAGGGIYACVEIDNADSVTLENLVCQNSGVSAITVLGMVSAVKVIRCVARNSSEGIRFFGPSSLPAGGSVEDCVAYSNSSNGIRFHGEVSASSVIRALCYDNMGSGIYVTPDNATTVKIDGATVYNNETRGIELVGLVGWTAQVTSSVVYHSTYNQAIYVGSNASYSGDYNCFYPVNGASLGIYGATTVPDLIEWKKMVGQDFHSIEADPLFVDPDGADNTLGGSNGDDDDFHPQSTAGSYHFGSWTADVADSPCVDSGAPWGYYTSESTPRGPCMNMGAYGGTVRASRSPSSIDGTNYYVNDASQVGDVYTTAVGNAGNSGLTPALPKATVENVLSIYDLGPGDRILVDDGSYTVTGIVVLAADGGSAAYPMQIMGRPFSPNSSLNSEFYNSMHKAGEYCFEFSEVAAYHVELINIDTYNGGSGVYIDGATDVTLTECEIWGAVDGVYCLESSNVKIRDCRIHCNNNAGIRLEGADNITVVNSLLYNNPPVGNVANDIYTLASTTPTNCSNIHLWNNTIYGNNSVCVKLTGTDSADLYNNIIQQLNSGTGVACVAVDAGSQAGFVSNYNNLVAGEWTGTWGVTDQADLAAWQAASSQDANSQEITPTFVNPAGVDTTLGSAMGDDDDFHLQSVYGSFHQDTRVFTQDASTSSGIDAGDPGDPYLNENTPNGGQINQGAYGNTFEASLTTGQWYYVNDGDTTNDIYCSGGGNVENNGLTPGSPLDTVAGVLAAYDIEPGDTIYVDTGSYTDAFAVTTADEGSATDPVTIIGSTYDSGRGSVFTIASAISVDASYVTLRNLAVDGPNASSAIRILSTGGATTDVMVEKCWLYNGGGGVQIDGTNNITNASVEDCVIYSNTGNGVTVVNNVVSSLVGGNIIYDNAAFGVSVFTTVAATSTIGSNTIYENSMPGIYVSGSLSPTVKDNIVYTSAAGGYCITKDAGVSYTGNYNCFYAPSGFVGDWETVDQTTLGDWQTASSQDANSISADPLFVDPDGADNILGGTNGFDDSFHLQSIRGSYKAGSFTADAAHSPCIDAGDPVTVYADEQAPNGGRVNMGAYGDTTEASLSVPVVQFDTAGASGGEGTTPGTIGVSLSMSYDLTTTVNYAVTGGTATGSGTDYTLASGTLTFTAGVTAQNISVTIVNDTLDEVNETIQVTLSSPSNATLGANTVHMYTITDDDAAPTVAFSAASSSGGEATTPALLTVALSAASGQTVTADYAVSGGTATGGGTDYTLAGGTLTFPAGVTTQNVSITVVNDTLDEANETVIVGIAVPTNATLGATTSHTYTITDDDAAPTVQCTATTGSALENTVAGSIWVELSAASGQTVTVDYSITGGTATGGGTDYTLLDGTVTFSPGITTNSITVGLDDDVLPEGNETVEVTLAAPTNATLGVNTVHTFTITDDDAAPTVSFAAASSSGAESATPATLAVELSAASALTVTVNYAVSGGTATGGGTDYTLAGGTLTFTPGTTSQNISATIVNDAAVEGDETIIVDISGPLNATLGAMTSHTYTVTDDDTTDDTDGDGLDDTWETTYFGGLGQDGTSDYDSDGLTNEQEETAGTDPTATDTDGDGMPDGWEATNGLDPTTDDASADADGDGYSNLDEYLGASDPQDIADLPIPDDVETLVASVGADSTQLIWTPSPTPAKTTGYKVYVSTDGGSTYDAGTDVGNVNSYDVAGTVPTTSYTFLVTGYSGAGYESAGLTATTTAGAATTVSRTVTGGTDATNYMMISFPIIPEEGILAQLEAVLGPYDAVSWRLLRWKPAGGGYDEDAAVADVRPGLAYWLISRNAASLSFDGYTNSGASYYPIRLEPGWNQIGNPYEGVVDWTGCCVMDGTAMIPVTDAANTFTSHNLWAYAGASGYLLATQLIPYEGYWLKNNDTADRILMVPVPVDKPGAVLKQIYRQPDGTEELPPPPPGFSPEAEGDIRGGCFIDTAREKGSLHGYIRRD